MLIYLIELIFSLVLAYFIIRFLFVYFWKINSKIIYGLLMSILSPLVFVMIFCLFHCIAYDKEFNSSAWKSNPESRKRMTNNLLKSKQLLGKNKDEVIKVLGADYEENGINKNMIFYIIDENSYGGDPEVIYIKFINGKVINIGTSSS